MALLPDRGKPIFPPEKNVNNRQISRLTDAAYDLRHEELGTRGPVRSSR